LHSSLIMPFLFLLIHMLFVLLADFASIFGCHHQIV